MKGFLHKSKILSLVAFVGLSVSASTTYAEIYRYQDANGKWHFTDQAPKGKIKAETVEIESNRLSSESESNAESKNFLLSLTDKYSPVTPIEKATLAVVKIESLFGSGSGFFVNNQCHIVTNRHVVRPTETKSWKEIEEKFEESAKKINKVKIALKEEEERLSRLERSLKKQRDYIDELPNSGYKQVEEKEYQEYKALYEKDTKKLDIDRKNLQADEREFNKEKSSFSLDSSMANVAKSFTVILKDDTKTKARLVHLSKEDDLALLKIDGCKSHYLKPDTLSDLRQGTKVYSIGSPLGQSDHVTSGIITNLKPDSIVTDAQVLPGNSGGPLISEEGTYLGVNTLKYSKDNPNAQGFGIAIPAKTVVDELGKFYMNVATQAE